VAEVSLPHHGDAGCCESLMPSLPPLPPNPATAPATESAPGPAPPLPLCLVRSRAERFWTRDRRRSPTRLGSGFFFSYSLEEGMWRALLIG